MTSAGVDLEGVPAQASESSLSAQQARLGELRELAARVAEAAGVDASSVPLGAELAQLGRRLQEVRLALDRLAQAAEQRAAGHHELRAARHFLDSVQQSLAAVEEATEQDAEQQLGALRSHLLALGKTESQLQQLRGSAETSVDDAPVVEVLALWQQVFRETFQQYHRLSARLVRGQDGAAALRLWQEYLVHVQAFLSAGVPGDYKALAEHQHLCEVHQNLLTNQQNVLLSKNDSDGLLGSGLIESSVVEQFASLTNLHNETLARIMDRHAEVRARLDAWDRYRQDQAVLLAWLRDTERERARLQLRYIHLRCLPKILLRIQALIEKIPSGEVQAESLQQQQSSLLTFCDEALATSIRMEHAAIVQRISNLGAALETWREFLERISNLAASFEQQAAAVTTAFNEVRSTIEQSGADTPVSVNAVSERLERLKELRTQLADRTADLESLGVTLEQLKECAAPQDMKAATQRAWLLWQAQADLEHQLTLLCHRLEERIGLRTLFDTRQSRFMTWASEVEARLERSSTADAEEVLRRLETELQAEVALKRREAEWLTRTGRELLAEMDTNADPELKERVERVETRWRELQDLGRSRAARLAELLQTMSQLELRLAELRAWLHQVESKLATPLVFETCSKETVDQKLREHEELQKAIEKQSSNVGEVLNLCELLLTNCEACKATINTESITIATDMLEQRWKNVCGQSAERKRRIIALCQLIQDLQKLCTEQEDWLTAQELVLKELDSRQDLRSQSEIQSFVSRIDGVLKEVETRAPALRILDQSYSRLHKESTLLEPENMRQLTSGARSVLRRWHDLAPAAAAAQQRLFRELQRYRDFAAAHSRALVALTQFDISLTQAQHLTQQLDSSQLTQLETDLEGLSPLVQEVEEVGNRVLQRCSTEETSELRGMLNECQLLWSDIRERFWQLREKCSSQVVDSAIQVETLRFEQDSAVQVDTLKLTSDDAYRYELESAMRECSANLDQLEDVASRTKITPRSSEISKALAAARSSIELVRHLSSLLPENRAAADRVRVLGERFDRMVANIQAREQQEKELRSTFAEAYYFICEHESTRLTCPLCSRRNWQQLDNDLWRLEQWLQYAEATQSAQSSPPNDIEKLEDTIQDHREFLMDLDSHKSIVVSLNIVGSHLADHTEDIEHADQLRARLATTNSRWDTVCRAAARWQAQLQVALMENSEFHHIIEELVEWLEKTENIIRQTEPVDLADDAAVIEAKYNKFRELRCDLERCEPRVMSLQEAADQLLRQPEEEGGVNTGSNTWARLTDLRLRLQSLRRLTGVYVLKLGAVLGREPSEMGTPVPSATAATSLASLPLELVNQTSSSQADVSLHGDQQQGSDTDMDTSVLTRGYRFLGRVIRASLPIQALMLLLLGVASLVPTGEEDYACNLSNTFARGLEPMLRYPNGPPPV
ncbi:muscle-specific protein 300 kDa-like [Schistocerca nitens]|uniref:muscle-specific protein 300 kDa-like n=1 Tax=Schistocerca nitens TaxID=7011 RepID=UPI00211790B3|nr:muscle-specific protein 300 kDa-like [Schistocerca nitens]